uniref:Uncharacterized protein n=1 Tax=Chaetoceros debilis TaxID=122233 RepID=A0A7S3QJ57_9STRA|mmetsp:Transcript_21218/g.32238  ORF Transcript_21218/g.32238 Transcript_21218/m.32238 type:complete len:595 (+) Transcript_21218:93-1877(+)|eukprot:CAMPEP_0194073844 /NCGR_PEP_ID=MMETSP0149-20130528/1085_1 /TAXON_ID=122233 /ORGANISM="Chaetoceros debilis, Strain MM31A-1" /LENGTH=594 /DNA_ID=CAMNT_0038753891 /DNA_START=27 /DNA_END=1811 /DNA_ORIENTATION=-
MVVSLSSEYSISHHRLAGMRPKSQKYIEFMRLKKEARYGRRDSSTCGSSESKNEVTLPATFSLSSESASNEERRDDFTLETSRKSSTSAESKKSTITPEQRQLYLAELQNGLKQVRTDSRDSCERKTGPPSHNDRKAYITKLKAEKLKKAHRAKSFTQEHFSVKSVHWDTNSVEYRQNEIKDKLSLQMRRIKKGFEKRDEKKITAHERKVAENIDKPTETQRTVPRRLKIIQKTVTTNNVSPKSSPRSKSRVSEASGFEEMKEPRLPKEAIQQSSREMKVQNQRPSEKLECLGSLSAEEREDAGRNRFIATGSISEDIQGRDSADNDSADYDSADNDSTNSDSADDDSTDSDSNIENPTFDNATTDIEDPTFDNASTNIEDPTFYNATTNSVSHIEETTTRSNVLSEDEDASTGSEFLDDKDITTSHNKEFLKDKDVLTKHNAINSAALDKVFATEELEFLDAFKVNCNFEALERLDIEPSKPYHLMSTTAEVTNNESLETNDPQNYLNEKNKVHNEELLSDASEQLQKDNVKNPDEHNEPGGMWKMSLMQMLSAGLFGDIDAVNQVYVPPLEAVNIEFVPGNQTYSDVTDPCL